MNGLWIYQQQLSTNLLYRKQYALLRSNGVRVGGPECMVPPTPSLGACAPPPPAPPPMPVFSILNHREMLGVGSDWNSKDSLPGIDIQYCK